MLTRTELKSRPLTHPKKIACLLYSLFSYLFFLLTFLYFIGFLGNVGVHKILTQVQASLGHGHCSSTSC